MVKKVQKTVGSSTAVRKKVEAPEWADWFDGMTFTSDWTSHNFKNWARILNWWRDKPVRLLEIGSFEGRSAVWFLRYFKECQLTCVDPFQWESQEENFDANLQPFSGRFKKVKDFSLYHLTELVREKSVFDIIYIDGSHMRDDVLLDSLLCWRLLRPRGILIWDDYMWMPNNAPKERVQPAVDNFLELHGDVITVLSKGWQMAIRKEHEPKRPA